MIKVALIGAGYFAAHHLDAWDRIEDVEVCAIADVDLPRARALSGHRDVAVYDDVDRLLSEVQPDVTDIVTPPDTHHHLAVRAARQGSHVICQKPLAPSLEEARALVDEMAIYGVRFMVHENWRWQPWYRTIRGLIDDGTTGTPYSAHFTLRTGDGWQRDAYLDRQPYFRHYPRLLLHETGVHLIDTFRYLFGTVASVYAQTRTRNAEIAGEDAGVAVLTFADGLIATLDASRYNEPDRSTVDPRYTFGRLRLDTQHGHVNLSPDGSVTWQQLGQPPDDVLTDAPTSGFAGDSVHAVQQHFISQLRRDEPFESEPTDYLTTIEVVEACYQAAYENSVVKLPHQTPMRNLAT